MKANKMIKIVAVVLVTGLMSIPYISIAGMYDKCDSNADNCQQECSEGDFNERDTQGCLVLCAIESNKCYDKTYKGAVNKYLAARKAIIKGATKKLKKCIGGCSGKNTERRKDKCANKCYDSFQDHIEDRSIELIEEVFD